MHVVDTTLFYSPTSGGVRRYLNAKHEWYGRHPQLRHSLLVPGRRSALAAGAVSTIAGTVVPGTFNYRLPLAPGRWTRMLAALEPDVVEAGDAFHPAWSALKVARLRGIPAVTFFHSHLPQLVASRCGPATGRLAARYLRSLYERFDMVFAPSRITCAYLRSLGLRRVMQQPLGVDTDIFHPRCRDRGLRRELGLARDTRLLVYAGRFSAEKNIAPLQAAFARLGSGYHLLMVGGGESRRTGNITVLPYRRDSAALARLLASADALVHAGTAETFGLIVLEAMACGRPIVAVRAGAVAELVDDEVGIAADRATGDCLAAAVRELYERDLPALRRAARQRIESRFSWHATMLEQLAAYRSLRPASAGQPNPVVALPPAESRSKVPGLDITPAP